MQLMAPNLIHTGDHDKIHAIVQDFFPKILFSKIRVGGISMGPGGKGIENTVLHIPLHFISDTKMCWDWAKK